MKCKALINKYFIWKYSIFTSGNENLHNLYDKHNLEVTNNGNEQHQVHLPLISYNYQDYTANNQKWISTGTETHQQISHLYIIPINSTIYIEIEFVFMQNDDVDLRSFVLDVSENEVNRMLSTFSLRYAPGNDGAVVVEDMSQPDLKSIIESEIKKIENPH